MVQCSGKCKKEGRRGEPAGRPCRRQGEPNDGSLYFCADHKLCKGTVNRNPCLSRAEYGIYCSPAHDPIFSRFKPKQFRKELLPVSRRQLLHEYGSTDAYTGKTLAEDKAHRDHIMECQMPAHVFNQLFADYKCRGYATSEISNAIPVVEEFTNDQNNLVPVHAATNIFKGAGVKSYLDARTYSRNALFTSCLRDAPKRISKNELARMEMKTLDRQATATIRRMVANQTRLVCYELDGKADNETDRHLANLFHRLSVDISNS